jgi:hypothetical protein
MFSVGHDRHDAELVGARDEFDANPKRREAMCGAPLHIRLWASAE